METPFAMKRLAKLDNFIFAKMRFLTSAKLGVGTCSRVYWRQLCCRGSSCATGCKATSGAVTTKSLRSRLTEGLSDKCFLHGKFSENQALLRVHSSKFAFSQWYFVGNGLARSVRTKVLLRIPPCRKPTNGKHHSNIEEKRL